MNRKWLIFGVLSAIIVVLDQWSKIWIRAHLDVGRDSIEVVDGLFQIVHVINTGAAFGMGANSPWAMPVFLIFTVLAIGFILYTMWDKETQGTFLPIILALIFSGAIGNAIDRVHKQGVTDFLRFYIDSPDAKLWMIENLGTNEYPSFNVADMAIVIGVILFFIYELRRARDEKAQKAKASAEAAS